MALNDSLISYNSNSKSITGFFPGNDNISKGIYNMYSESDGKISMQNDILTIDIYNSLSAESSV